MKLEIIIVPHTQSSRSLFSVHQIIQINPAPFQPIYNINYMLLKNNLFVTDISTLFLVDPLLV